MQRRLLVTGFLGLVTLLACASTSDPDDGGAAASYGRCDIVHISDEDQDHECTELTVVKEGAGKTFEEDCERRAMGESYSTSLGYSSTEHCPDDGLVAVCSIVGKGYDEGFRNDVYCYEKLTNGERDEAATARKLDSCRAACNGWAATADVMLYLDGERPSTN